MNTPEHLIVVSDEEGRSLICKLDHECSDSVCRLDNYWKIPKKFRELTEHERSSCNDLLSNAW